MIKIIYPEENPRVRKKDVPEVYCMNRKRWVKLTKEEWVRQNFLLYLDKVCGYPTALTAVEKKLLIDKVIKRFDIVVYKDEKPFLIVECKEMNVSLDMEVMMQVLRYNITIGAKFVAITNGVYTYLFENQKGEMVEINVFPSFK